jgi:hypothetical protein
LSPSVTTTKTSTPTRTKTPTVTRTPPKSPVPTGTPTRTIPLSPSVTTTKTSTPTRTKTPTVTRTPPKSPIPTTTPTPTITQTVSVTRTKTPTLTRTPTRTITRTPNRSPLPTRTPTKTKTPTITPTNTITPTKTPTRTVTPTPTYNCFTLIDTVSATTPVSAVTITTGNTSIGYALSGTRFYNVPQTIGSIPTLGVFSNYIHQSTTAGMWRSTNDFDGPLNRLSIWSNPNIICNWVGFSKCLELPTSKYYYVGLSADNHYRLYLDGVLLVDTTSISPCTTNSSGECTGTLSGGGGGNSLIFNYFRVYRLFIESGTHTIQMVGQNCGELAMLGLEIYDNTIDELTGATSVNELNIVFSTEELRNAYFTGGTINVDVVISSQTGEYINLGYTCPEGYTYGCGNCYRFVNSCITPTPTKSLTRTPTPTISQTKTQTPTIP